MRNHESVFLKIIVISLFFSFFLLIVTKEEVHARQFLKTQANPLSITLTDGYAQMLQIDVYEKNSLGCRAIATVRRSTETFFSLVTLRSINCLSWQIEKEVLNVGQSLTNPRVFFEETGQLILFFTKEEEPNFYQIYRVNCDQQLNCSLSFSPVLDPNRNDWQERHGYFAGKVIKLENRYFILWCLGRGWFQD
ncbi:MAG: hypothetical protein NZL96_00065 [Patescibacteria group bacterium]|nr:hypothetical protein [Patescibacteria group bacterium]